jgi:hypothetical protein
MDNIILGQFALSALCLVLISVYLNHLLANTRAKINRRIDQGIKVVEAFRPELDALMRTNNDALLIMTDEAFIRHDSAIRNFLLYLSWIDRLILWHNWRALAYHQKDKDRRIPLYEQYADCGSLDKRKEIRPLIIKRIERIISFANKEKRCFLAYLP